MSRDASGSAASAAAPSKHAPWCDVVRRRAPGATPRQTRRALRRFRARDTERASAPSIGPTRISRSERACRVRCSLTRRCPAPCRVPRAWATSSKNGWSLHAIPCRLRARCAVGCPAATARRTVGERCVAPTSATELRPEHPTDCPIPGCVPRCASRPFRALGAAAHAGSPSANGRGRAAG